MRNLLVSGNVHSKIEWYIKAHGHSSIGGLNLIWIYFDLNNKKEIAKLIHSAITKFEDFSESDDIDKSLKELSQKVNEINDVISAEDMVSEKKEEMTEILKSVKKNIIRINKIMRNPGYIESFKLSKILFSTCVQLLKSYPHVLYGDLIGRNGKDTGNRIQLLLVQSYEDEKGEIQTKFEENDMLCCGYEIQLLLFNLLANAVEAISSTGNITIMVKYKKDKVFIDIIDDGDLLSDSEIKKIKAQQKKSKKGPTHGHGLKIIHDIVEKYNGKLDVKCDAKKHSVKFSVMLPIMSNK